MTSTVKEIPVIWLASSACTGCSISLLNSASPTIKNVLVDQVVPGVHVNLRFHATIMAGSGEPAIKVMEDTAREKKDGYVLITEGAIPTAPEAVYGAIGERNGKPVSMEEKVLFYVRGHPLGKDSSAGPRRQGENFFSRV